MALIIKRWGLIVLEVVKDLLYIFAEVIIIFCFVQYLCFLRYVDYLVKRYRMSGYILRKSCSGFLVFCRDKDGTN